MKKSFIYIICLVFITLLTFSLCACDDEKPLNEENCDNGHDLVQSSYTAPTCKTTGEEVKKCSRCGFESKTTLLTIAHNYEVKLTIESTCTTRGYQTSECSMCHETKTTTLDLKEHDYKLISSTPSTCIVKGHNNYKCNNCSATKTKELDLSEHTYKIVTENATCFTHGSTKEICEICQDTKLINETPLLTHSFETDGYCSKCGIFETLFDESKLNIQYNGWESTKENLIKITGDLLTKFNNNQTIPHIYWKDQIVKLKIYIYDEENNYINSAIFYSTYINNSMAIETGNGALANKIFLHFGNYQYFTMTELQQCTSFKLELSCEGYKTIEKTYEIEK